jgi:pyruvate/2-oxoglutarate/acetoin dehydrogenase E1 component
MNEFREMDLRGAVLEALFDAMRADPAVVVIGEDVGAAGGVFKQTDGLFAEFGAARVIDTPISEPGAFGMAVGAAMTGLRPVFEVMFGDFMTLVMDQLVNQAAKVRYMSAGAAGVPLVLRTTLGVGAGLGPQHSQGFHAWAAHVPGLKVAVPSCPADAKGLFTAAIEDDDPVLVFEDRALYGVRGPVPAGRHVVRLGEAAVRRQGRDITLVAIGRMVGRALVAAEMLAADGIEAEVIDPRCLVPLDVDALIGSVRRTGRALVLDAAPRRYGVTGEIAATINELAFDWLDAPVARMAAADLPVPLAASLEALVQPDAAAIAAQARKMVLGR